MRKIPPHESPGVYALITGPDDSSFCKRISDLLGRGYLLHGSPSVTYDSERQIVIAAQAIVWPGWERNDG